MTTKKWGRLLTAMITPYDNAGEVNVQQAATLAEKLLQHGSDGLVLWGTTSESPALSMNEKERIYTAVREKTGTTGTLIVATGTNSTKHSVEQTIRAQHLGADGVMVVVPYYNKPSQSGLYEHFRSIASSTDLPVMIYNVPSRSGVAIDVETVARLAEVPNVVAIKEAAGSVIQVSHLRSVLPKEFLIYSGDDPLTLPMLSVGAYGVVSVASHVAGQAISEMIAAYLAGEVEKALELHEKLLPLNEALFCDVNPVPLKVMLDELGFSTGGCRLPLVAPSDSKKEHIRGTLQTVRAELIDAHFNQEFGNTRA